MSKRPDTIADQFLSTFRAGQQSILDMLREPDEEFVNKLIDAWRYVVAQKDADIREMVRVGVEQDLADLASAIQEKIDKERGE